MKQFNFLLSLLALLAFSTGQLWAETYTLGWGYANGKDGAFTNFAATSGSVDNIVSFTTAKESATTSPSYNYSNKDLRLFYAANGEGGSITLVPAERVTITGFLILTATTPSVKYSVDGGTALPVSASYITYSVSGISATSSLKIQNANKSSLALQIQKLQITYTVSEPVVTPATRLEPLAAFEKVTSTEDITDGDYLIVYEDNGTFLALDGALETLDVANNNIEVTEEDGYIKAPGYAIFTIDVSAGTIKSYSGSYIGVSANSEGLRQSSDANTYSNSFSISDDNAVISALFANSAMTLRFNNSANAKRFRFYENASQQAIRLYKKKSPATLREVTTGAWGTFCPQTKTIVPQGASFYTLTYKELSDGVPCKVYFDEIAEGESLEAGKPYLFIAEETAITGIEHGAAAVTASNYNGFHGIVGNSDYVLTVTQEESDAYKYYVIYQNEIRRCGAGDFTLKAGRAYIDMSELTSNVSAPAPGRRRVGLANPEAPQSATGLDEINNPGKVVKMFIGEQLVFLRDGKIYDTTGRLIDTIQ